MNCVLTGIACIALALFGSCGSTHEALAVVILGVAVLKQFTRLVSFVAQQPLTSCELLPCL